MLCDLSMSSFVFSVPEELQAVIYSSWLTVEDLSSLDLAVCETVSRTVFLSTLHQAVHAAERLHNLSYDVDFLKWSIQRGIRFDGINVTDSLTDDAQLLSSFLVLSGPTARWINFKCYSCPDSTAAISQISQQCGKARKLSMRGEDDSFIEGLLQVFRYNPHLEEIVLRNGISINALKATSQLPALKVLRFEGLYGDNVISEAIAVPTLEVLDASGCVLTESAQFAIAQRCPKLRTLRIFGRNRGQRTPSGVTDAGLRAMLQGCPLLRMVDVEYAAELSDEMRIELVRRCEVTEIDMIDWAGVSAGLLVDICKASPSLQKLYQASHWTYPPRSPDIGNAIDKALLAVGENCPLLAILHLPTHRYISFEALRAVVKPGNKLRHIHLGAEWSLDDKAVVLIAEHCPLLEILSCPVRTADVGVVALMNNCPRLAVLCLRSTYVTDYGLFVVAEQCTRLTFLDLRDCKHVTAVGVLALRDSGVKLDAEQLLLSPQLAGV
jgi:hypothetical protein